MTDLTHAEDEPNQNSIQYPNGNFVWDPSEKTQNEGLSFPQRLISVATGGFAILAGLALIPVRKHKMAWALISTGFGMTLRGVTGRCFILKSLGLQCNTHLSQSSEYFKGRYYSFESEVTVNQSPDAVFQFLSNVRNLSSVIPGVRSIINLGEKKSHWTLKDGKQLTVSLNSQSAKRLLSWQGLKKGLPQAVGSLRIEEDSNSGEKLGLASQSIIHINLAYKLPMLPIKHWVYQILKKGPEYLALKSLQRLKFQLEA